MTGVVAAEVEALVIEVPRFLVGVLAGVVVIGACVAGVAWATRDRAADVDRTIEAIREDRASRGALLPRTRVMHPERGLGTIAVDPPLPGGIFPVLFDLDHPRRVRWEPSTLLSPVSPADEEHLEAIRRRGAEVFPMRPPTPRPEPLIFTPAAHEPDPAPCAPGRPCPWHVPDDCVVARCCDACPTNPDR